MARTVMKFGGTSVADVDRIQAVARLAKREIDAGNEVAVVVSAMAGVTNRLEGYVREISRLFDLREYDTVVSAGEQTTAGLTAIALQELGVDARSWLGWQVPIHTDSAHGSASIAGIDGEAIVDRMRTGEVAVFAGYQGLDPERQRITTLGRGGSDTSAVALAGAINADRCDIYTDVDGVYTTDPRIVSGARKLARITYEEMLEMASQGAKVLQTRAVEMAMRHRVPVQVRSTFDPDTPGTLVVDEDSIVEHDIVSGIAYSRDEAKITLTRVADRPGVAAGIFGPLAEEHINVDMIVQNVSPEGDATDVTFTVSKSDYERAMKLLEDKKETFGYQELRPDEHVVKVSVIGVGMRSHAGVAQTMFRALAEKGINISVIATSEIKISVLIPDEYLELALRTLHAAYDLDSG
mgnify:CR=1 FL=1